MWDAQTAWLGLDMIRGVVNDLTESQGGLATRAQIPGWDVGGKTGTTNDVKDLWFAGVTPLISGAVWVGNANGQPLPGWAYSGEIPTPVWQQAVAGALAGQPRVPFAEPGGITYRVVRQVEMAFREAEADTEQVARDGSGRSSGGGGFFGGRRGRFQAPPPQPEPVPEVPVQEPPVEAAPWEEVPASEPPVQDEFGGGQGDGDALPEDTPGQPEAVPVEPVEEPTAPEPGFTDAPPEAPPTDPEPLPDPAPEEDPGVDGELPVPPDGFFEGEPGGAVELPPMY